MKVKNKQKQISLTWKRAVALRSCVRMAMSRRCNSDLLKLSVATQASSLYYGKPLKSTKAQGKIQLLGSEISAGRCTDQSSQSANTRVHARQQALPFYEEGKQAVSLTQDGPSATATVPPVRLSSRVKGLISHSRSLNRPSSSKERFGIASHLQRLRRGNGLTWATPCPVLLPPHWLVLVVDGAWRPVP